MSNCRGNALASETEPKLDKSTTFFRNIYDEMEDDSDSKLFLFQLKAYD